MVRRSDKDKQELKSTDLNFMVVKGTDKVRRFRVSSRLLGFALVFFLAYILITLVIINKYFTLRSKYEGEKEKAQSMAMHIASLKRRLYEARQQLTLIKRKSRQKVLPQKIAENTMTHHAINGLPLRDVKEAQRKR